MNQVQKFMNDLQDKRGFMKGVNAEMTDIFIFGTDSLVQFMLDTKLIGVKKAALVAHTLSHENQDEFVKWICETRRTKNEVDLKIMELTDAN